MKPASETAPSILLLAAATALLVAVWRNDRPEEKANPVVLSAHDRGRHAPALSAQAIGRRSVTSACVPLPRTVRAEDIALRGASAAVVLRIAPEETVILAADQFEERRPRMPLDSLLQHAQSFFSRAW